MHHVCGAHKVSNIYTCVLHAQFLQLYTGSPFRVNITGDYIRDDSTDNAPRATPISPGLEPIMEESEDDEMVVSSEPTMRKRKRGKKKKKGVVGGGMIPMMPVLVMNPYVNLEPGQMPTFHPGKNGQVPYQVAFTPMAMQPPSSRGTKHRKKASAKNSKGHTVSFDSKVSLSPDPSSTNLNSRSGKMLTFSSLRVKKTKSSDEDASKVGGSFTGHASMNIGTVTNKSSTVVKGIMKKSTSNSSASSNN